MQRFDMERVRIPDGGDRNPDGPVAAGPDDEMTRRLRQRFGLDSFHPWQREAIDELLHGRRRALVVAPTGGGKSLCYQFPATELDGTTVVVSPLIALMEDQVRGLAERGIPATWISSTLDADERRRRIGGIWRGQYRIVYLAPERIAFDGTLQMLRELAPPLVAIDEAHCISHWGHDFRPHYLELKGVLEALAPRHVLACTATATPLVRDEIVRLLGLPAEDTAVFVRGFARPNLHLAVLEIDGPQQRRRVAVSELRRRLGDPARPAGAAIIYAGTRREAEQGAALAVQRGWRAAAYHAGIRGSVRADVNRRFAAGELDVVVATNAFGMGIDRPDIRAVIHVNAPGSIEAYYQEVGRAGRDGAPAHGLLMASTADFGLRKRLIGSLRSDGTPPDPEHVKRQWRLFLDLMRYVEAGSCRHDTILRYFEDEVEALGGCGNCDVCARLGKVAETRDDEPAVSAEDALIVRKALQGVAEARRRAGLIAIAEMLAGSRNRRVEQLGLLYREAHGLLADRPRPWILALLRRCMTAGLVDVTAGDFPVPYLTPAGLAAMRDQRPIRLLLPPQQTAAPPAPRPKRTSPVPSTDLDPAVNDLFQQLRAARLEKAREAGVPAYCICHDRTLMEIAIHQPTTPTDLAEIHGMGPVKLEAHGGWILEAVRENFPASACERTHVED